MSRDEHRAMLRNLLIERLYLSYHLKTRQIKRYEISVGRTPGTTC